MADLRSTNVIGNLTVIGETTTTRIDVAGDGKVQGVLELGMTPEATGEKNYAVGTHDLLNLFYPIGTVYMSVTQDDGTNSRPDTRNDSTKNGCPIAYNLGGTWVRFAEGRTPVGVGRTTDQDGEQAVVGLEDKWGYRSTKLVRHQHGGWTGNTSLDITGPSKDLTGNAYFYNTWGSYDQTIRSTNGIFRKGYSSNDGASSMEVSWEQHKPLYLYIDANHKHYVNPNPHNHSISWEGSITGSNNARNWQPSIGVFMWKRVE